MYNRILKPIDILAGVLKHAGAKVQAASAAALVFGVVIGFAMVALVRSMGS